MDPARKLGLAPQPARDARRIPAAIRGGLLGISTLAVVLGPDGKLPTEFRIFTAGWNDTENGRVLFDAEAASATMAAYAKWGVDLAIDLEHQMLSTEAPPEPTARDARGWCKLRLGADGELWAVNVTWTPDGTARLTDKRQRYVSPAFGYDPKTSRITKMLNIAITAIPATHDTPALVAASAIEGGSMDPALIAKALDALVKGDSKAALDILKSIVVSAAGGDTEDAPPPEGDGGADEAAEGEPPVAAAAAVPAGDAPAAEDPAKKKDPMMAAARIALALTGMTDPGQAMAELSRRSKLAVDLEAREAKLSADRVTLESGERRALVASLVKLGAEIPATAWGDAKGSVPCARLAAEPIADLRSRVAMLSAASGAPRKITPPASGGTEGLTPREIALCAEKKIDPAKYAATRAGIASRNVQRA